MSTLSLRQGHICPCLRELVPKFYLLIYRYILHFIWFHIYFDITTVFVKVLCYIELSFK